MMKGRNKVGTDSSNLSDMLHRNSEFENYRKLYENSTPWRGHVDAKLDIASPYCFFLTRVQDSADTHDEDLTITFPELLDSSLGVLEHSLHINFMVELDWLLAQYLITGHRNPSMTILYDSIDQVIPEHLNVKGIKVQSRFSFGHHHTKMSVFFYTDKSLRFVVYTANLIESDWENRTQGVWVSPLCPYLGNGVPFNYGESETLFKYEMLKYLNSYHLPQLKQWLVRIQKADLSQIQVCLVPSVPGDILQNSGGYKKMYKLIKDYAPPSEHSSWDLVAQCSSIGSLGNNPNVWLLNEFARSLTGKSGSKSSCPVKLIYPSFENVKQSHNGLLGGGGCLPYQSTTHKKQLWLRTILHQWKSDHRHRSKAVPHIKTYAQVSPDGTKLSWFLLTSANLSKAAWGKPCGNGKVQLMSYELGVLFLPGYLIGKKYFNIKKGGNVENDKESFPVPYDIPVQAYSDCDEIFLFDKCYGS